MDQVISWPVGCLFDGSPENAFPLVVNMTFITSAALPDKSGHFGALIASLRVGEYKSALQLVFNPSGIKSVSTAEFPHRSLLYV